MANAKNKKKDVVAVIEPIISSGSGVFNFSDGSRYEGITYESFISIFYPTALPWAMPWHS